MKLKCISSAATPICWKPLIQQVITQKIKKNLYITANIMMLILISPNP